ncbi:MAG: energy-coupling factor transporter ATPase [Defluviitaleaceae bacterium]|nr:energy-coupling factor transporter ATPase [Defluviitaleaceae bacterium]
MILAAENLTHIYQRGTVFEKKALDGITMSVPKGAFAGVIGHTGSGKSTLIQHFNALLEPTSGKVWLDGEDLFAADKKKRKRLREKVGLVFQYPEHQLFETTVQKDIAFGPQNMGLSSDEVSRRVAEALEWVGLPKEAAQLSPFELSGGQKRRAAIAGVLAMKPEVLILDEPTAGLDPRGKNEILGQIKKMHESAGNTVILVSHGMDDVARLADIIFVMNNGRIEFSGSPAEVFREADKLAKIGLAVPQVYLLLRELIKRGADLPQNIFTAEAAAQAIKKLYEH